MNCADDVRIVRSLVEVSEVFLEIAAGLRSLAGSPAVTTPCFMRREDRLEGDSFRVGCGEGFRIEWYAEAECADGRGLSLGVEVAWHDGEWVVDACACTHDVDGEHTLFEIPRRHATSVDDLVAALEGQARLLLDSRDEAVRLFAQST